MLAIITLTKGSEKIAYKLKEMLTDAHIYTKDSYKDKYGCLDRLIKDLFNKYDSFIFIMATGIVVRLIAPLLVHKSKDPAVVVMDEKGNYAISLLSGHIGGANELAKYVASLLPNCNPVITTASDVNNMTSIDMFAKNNKLILKDFDNAKVLTSALIDGSKILVIDESKAISNLPDNYVFYNDKINVSDYGGILVITNRDDEYIVSKKYETKVMSVMHKNLVLGIGCRKNVPSDDLFNKVKKYFHKWGYSLDSLKYISSAWVKKDEQALIDLSDRLEVPYIVYEKKDIQEVESQFNSSDFVNKTLGVGCISEPCGYLASNKGKCLINKIKDNGVTLSLWEMKG
jgi:cobalt-precorrin 5A hydrolase